MPHVLSQLLYCARWIGTLLVLAVHSTALINFRGIIEAEQPAAMKAWRFVVSFDLGHHGIVGFFVMSGFLVGGSTLAHLRENKPFLLDYFIHRFARIYLVLIPAILITIILDGVGRTLFAGVGVYEAPFQQKHYNPLLILTDFLNLQGIVATHYGNNGPLWSVAYEFWYYMLFPLLLLPLSSGYSPRAGKLAAAAAAVVIIGVTLAQQWFIVGFILWGLGAAAAVPKRPLVRSAGLALLINIVTVISLRLTINGALPLDYPLIQYASDLVSALAFANLILTLRFSTGVTWRPLVPRIHKQLADLSITVYAIHNPSLLFLRAAATWLFGDVWLHHPATPEQWWALAVSMTIVLIVAFVLSRFTEAKTGAARRKLHQFVSRFERSPTAARVTPAQRSALGADTREPHLNA